MFNFFLVSCETWLFGKIYVRCGDSNKHYSLFSKYRQVALHVCLRLRSERPVVVFKDEIFEVLTTIQTKAVRQ